MELKTYQKVVMGDLEAYLAALDERSNLIRAWHAYWERKDMPIGENGVPDYQNKLPGTPHVCMKVPTGGGKTYLGCCALKRIFMHLPMYKSRIVVWLVPSEAILSQTVRNLSDPEHPYRQRLERDFGGRIEVCTKEMLLNGQHFSPDTVRESTVVCVFSYASLRIDSRKKDVRKVFQENGNLMRFAQYFDDTDALLADTPDTALIQVLRFLLPVVIVDESHNAGSALSIEMLDNLNPAFVLELTATPRNSSNIISYVNARELKKENMVKLPVMVYNRKDHQSVLQDAIHLRANLERAAAMQQEQGGEYIRPIVLFQAQPGIKEDSKTFAKIKEMLVNGGIPAEQIAIKTAGMDELGGVDLLSQACEIRYIITVNALKEGWDCPFAYILASLANKTSKVDVEQILGRILRQPYAKQQADPLLNTSYVLTCSADFQATLDGIVNALNRSGYSRREYRVALDDMTAAASMEDLQAQPAMAPAVVSQTVLSENIQNGTGTETAGTETAGIDTTGIETTGIDTTGIGTTGIDTKTADPETAGLAAAGSEAASAGEELFETVDAEALRDMFVKQKAAAADDTALSDMLTAAREQNERYQSEGDKEALPAGSSNGPKAACRFPMQAQFREEAEKIRLPQFFRVGEKDLFSDGFDLLAPEHLSEGFSLRGLDAQIHFEMAAGEMYRVDLQAEGEAIPKYKRVSKSDSERLQHYLEHFPQEERIRRCADGLVEQLSRNDRYIMEEIAEYVHRVVANMTEDELLAMESALPVYAGKIQKKIDALEQEYRMKQFLRWLDAGKIVCREDYALPAEVSFAESTEVIPDSLYEAEKDDMTRFERQLLDAMIGSERVRWWHRNPERKGFCINGYFNHYPDFIICTVSGKLLLVEAKGDHLDGDDSREKLALGRRWQAQAGARYRYFMVFQDKDMGLDSAYTLETFLEVLKEI
ncbi:MAG: DEAD/DEAH box helicase family protein [Lachnospiraceae bacterium]|nr:DEAD/DEAH box helicase family protein [Lachnospiraceae bacterium]